MKLADETLSITTDSDATSNVIEMPESNLHRFLKDVGRAFLFNQRCYLVATEVFLLRHGIASKLDRHWVIDICGIGEKYIPYIERIHKEEDVFDTPYKFNIMRGVEVKVSRNDFKNGFCCSGCNYHYLLVPKGLVSLSEVPKPVGLIEYDQNKFRAKFGYNRFWLEGLKVRRSPRFQQISNIQLESAMSKISSRVARELISKTADSICEGQKSQ